MKVALWAEIRRLSEIEKLSGHVIARRLHCSRHTGCRQPTCTHRLRWQSLFRAAAVRASPHHPARQPR